MATSSSLRSSSGKKRSKTTDLGSPSEDEDRRYTEQKIEQALEADIKDRISQSNDCETCALAEEDSDYITVRAAEITVYAAEYLGVQIHDGNIIKEALPPSEDGFHHQIQTNSSDVYLSVHNGMGAVIGIGRLSTECHVANWALYQEATVIFKEPNNGKQVGHGNLLYNIIKFRGLSDDAGCSAFIEQDSKADIAIMEEHFTEGVRISSGVCMQDWEAYKEALTGKRLCNPFGEISEAQLKEARCTCLEQFVLRDALVDA